jgi:hypothetical protein
MNDTSTVWRSTFCIGPWLVVARGQEEISDAMNLEACKHHCIARDFQGFCVWNGRAYFRDYHLVAANLHPVDGAEFFIPQPQTFDRQGLPLPVAWDVHTGQDAFPGQNADTKVMGSGTSQMNLEQCKQHCIDRDFQGFCVHVGKAYFRNFHRVAASLQPVAGAVFYIPEHQTRNGAPLPVVWSVHSGQDAFIGENADERVVSHGLSDAELEVDRRLSGFLAKLYREFLDDFIGNHIEVPLCSALYRLISEDPCKMDKDQVRKVCENDKRLGGYLEGTMVAAEVHERLEMVKAAFDSIIGSAVVEMKSFWMGELRAMLTAEVAICPADGEGDCDKKGGLRPYFNVATKWLSRILPSFDAPGNLSLDVLRRTLVDNPPFQLSSYADYTDAILTTMEGCFDKAAASLSAQIEQCVSSKITSFNCGTDWLEMDAEGTDYLSEPHAIAVKIRPHVLFGHLRIIFARLTPTPAMLRSAPQGIPVGGVSQAALARCRTLEMEITELKKARDGLCAALDIPSEELDEIRRKMAEDDLST